jgi:hypothetical protein
MRVLWPIAIGVLIVGVDFRLNAPDVAADPLGWVLVAIGAWLLVARGASLLAIVAAPLSAAGVFLDYRIAIVDSVTGAEVATCGSDAFCVEQLRYDDLGSLRALALLGAALAGGAALAWIVPILRTEVGDVTKQQQLRRQLRFLEVVVPLVWSLPVVILTTMAVLSGDGYDPVWDERLEVVSYARFAVMAWLAITLFTFADRYPRPVRRTATGVHSP